MFLELHPSLAEPDRANKQQGYLQRSISESVQSIEHQCRDDLDIDNCHASV